MARPERRDATPAHLPFPSASPLDEASDRAGYRPGGQVGQMQADLARRLASDGAVWEAATVSPGERVVRFVSVSGGGLALAAAYAGVVLLILR